MKTHMPQYRNGPGKKLRIPRPLLFPATAASFTRSSNAIRERPECQPLELKNSLRAFGFYDAFLSILPERWTLLLLPRRGWNLVSVTFNIVVRTENRSLIFPSVRYTKMQSAIIAVRISKLINKLAFFLNGKSHSICRGFNEKFFRDDEKSNYK